MLNVTNKSIANVNIPEIIIIIIIMEMRNGTFRDEKGEGKLSSIRFEIVVDDILVEFFLLVLLIGKRC